MDSPKRKPAIVVLQVLVILGVMVSACSQASDSGIATEATAVDDAGTESTSDSDVATEATAVDDAGTEGTDEGAVGSEADDEPSENEGEGAEDGETTIPDDTEPEGDDEELGAPEELEPSDVPVATWVMAGLVLLGAIVWMAARGGASANQEDEST